MALMASLSELEMHVFINEIQTVDKKIEKENQNISEVQSELQKKLSKKEALEQENPPLLGILKSCKANIRL